MCRLDSCGSKESRPIVPVSFNKVIKFYIQKGLTTCVIIKLSRKTFLHRNNPAPVW